MSEDLEGCISAHIDELRSSIDLTDLSNQFAQHGYVRLPRPVPTSAYAKMEADVRRLVDSAGSRIDLRIAETGETPRKMRTVERNAIRSGSATIASLYLSESLRGFLSDIAGDELLDCPWEHEQYVAICQTEPGDTHGWHWGDYPYTVIWVIEAPDDPAIGGALQCIPDTTWDKSNPRLDEWLASREPDTWHHGAGDAYFLRSDTTLHRTIPLSAPSRRTILNTCWASVKHPDEATHETMLDMFSVTE